MRPDIRPSRCLPVLWALAVLLTGCMSLPRSSRIDGGGLDRQADRLILVTVANPAAMASFDAGSTPHVYAAPWPWSVSARAQALGTALAQDYHLSVLREWPIAALKVDCFVYVLPPGGDRTALLAQLTRDSRVRMVEPLQLFEVKGADSDAVAPGPSDGRGKADAAYNDPYFNLQYGFRDIGADLAQRHSRGDGVRVAVIDTGVDIKHPDIGRVAVARDFFHEDAAAFRRDRHGTAVAGIIAAVVNNRIGIAGIAPGVRLQLYKACQPLSPDALAAQCNSFTLALALGAAIDARAQVVNLSLGGPADGLLASLIQAGQRRGMVFVGAVPDNGRLDGFPLDVPGVIAAGEVRDAAKEVDGGDSPTVLRAPGREVLSLAPAGHYDFVSGSSFAAAHVTAAVALLEARAPRLDAATLRAALAQTQRPDGPINVCVALLRLLSTRGASTGACANPARVFAHRTTRPSPTQEFAGF